MSLIVAGVACGSESTPPSELSREALPVFEELPPSPIPISTSTSAQKSTQVPQVASVASMPPITDIVDKVKPWVASISVETVFEGIFSRFTDEGSGSGIVVRPNGYVVTNAHVITGARDIKVHVDGQTYDGQVVGLDDVTDLALVRINAEDLPTARFATEEQIKVGQWVVSFGNALALKGGPTLTTGIISALGRTIQTETGQHFYNLIQTDAAMNDGSSGGPLVNLKGEVVGINHAILRQAAGMAFAISATDALPIIETLIADGKVVRPLIGFNGDDVTPAISARFQLGVIDGVLVTALTPRGPAHKAGIKLGDVIRKMDGVPTPDVATWLDLLWKYEVGTEVNVEYVRNAHIESTMITLTER